MSAITAVELGADTCALARASVQRGDLRVSAAEVLDPAQFPGSDGFTLALRQTRRALRLPKRCRVVVWGLREGASRRDAAVVPILRPLLDAGFKVERVVSPCNALAALARLKTVRGDGATCWLAVNRGGVAIVVVRPGQQLYAHSFVWDWTLGATGSQARLLQRYSLVSALAPEVRRAMAAALEKDSRIDAIVTCGNLPDLRSLTMPLIEELDVEVETLDSLEGLDVDPNVADRLADVAQGIRLACAGASARGARPWDEGRRRRHHMARWLRIAALIAGIAAVGFAWYAMWNAKRHAALSTTAHPVQASAVARKPDSNVPVGSTAAKPLPPAVSVPTLRPQTPIAIAPPSAGAKPGAQPKPAVQTPTLPVQQPPTVPARTVPRPPPTSPELRAPEEPRPQPTLGTTPLNSPSVPTDKVEARRPRPLPALLKEPAPRVTAILITNDRRYATLDGGHIAGVGDMVGRRLVVAIDEQAVVFREPSGALLRVGLGGRILGLERPNR